MGSDVFEGVAGYYVEVFLRGVLNFSLSIVSAVRVGKILLLIDLFELRGISYFD